MNGLRKMYMKYYTLLTLLLPSRLVLYLQIDPHSLFTLTNNMIQYSQLINNINYNCAVVLHVHVLASSSLCV